MHRHDKALEFAHKSLNTIINLLYDTYLFCYHLILRKNKSEKSREQTSTKDSEGMVSQPNDDTQKTSADDRERVDVKYLENLIRIIENVLKRVAEMGLERSDKEQTVQLMKKLVSQTQQKNKKKREDLMYSGRGNEDSLNPNEIDMKYVHEGYFEDHWLTHSTILSIAQLQFLTPDDVFFNLTDINEEVCSEVSLEKLSLLAVCFYAISTEYRFKEKIEEVQDKADKKALVQKETTVIAARFKDFDIQKKLQEADFVSLEKRQKPNKIEIKNSVPPS